MATKDRLAQVLREAGAPARMVTLAESGQYDDFLSDSPTPIVNLVRDLQFVGLHDLAMRVMGGEFDATKEEAEAWFEREGKRGAIG